MDCQPANRAEAAMAARISSPLRSSARPYPHGNRRVAGRRASMNATHNGSAVRASERLCTLSERSATEPVTTTTPNWASAVRLGDAAGGVLGMVDGVHDELPDVVGLDAIEDLVALATGLDEPSEAQLGEVLAHRRLWFAGAGGQVVDRELVLEQQPQQREPGAVGQHAEDLDGQRDLVLGRQRPAGLG